MTPRTLALLALFFPCATTARAADHLATLQEYALMVGDVSVAAKHCQAVKVDWTRLVAEGHLRGVSERDFPTLRDLARKRIDVVEAGLNDDADTREWCGDALVGYGPGGMAVDGILVP